MTNQSNENHVFIDTNVIVGAFAGNKDDNRCLAYLGGLNGKKLYISSLSVAQFASVLQNHKYQAEKIRKAIESFFSKYEIISFDEKDIKNSMQVKCNDIEDAIQYTLSEKTKCLFIVTNNIKHYRGNFLNKKVLLPKEARNIY